MSDFLQWVVLALVQGLTEFLPVSSSAHLILASKFAGWQDQGSMMDIAAHFGSLMAVLIYYRKEVFKLLSGHDWPLFQQLLVASMPLALAGLLTAGLVETYLRDEVWVIAAASAIFGVLLWFSQKFSNNQALNLKSAVIIGLVQCMALIPGASRSGVTMMAGMVLGLSKESAAKFSFLLAIPAILMVTAYGCLKIYKTPEAYDLTGVITIVILSFLAAWLCIHLFMKFIQKIDFIWFMHYRIILAVLILLTVI